jgi:hypothetical protein
MLIYKKVGTRILKKCLAAAVPDASQKMRALEKEQTHLLQ